MINEDETTDLKEAADTKEDKKTYISDQYDVTQTCTIETECEQTKMMMTNQSPTMLAIIMKKK